MINSLKKLFFKIIYNSNRPILWVIRYYKRQSHASSNYVESIQNEVAECPDNKWANLPKLPSAMRAGLRAKIADRVKKDPEFKKRVLDGIEAKLKDPASNLTETQRAMAQEYLNKKKSQQQSKHQYLTEAHRKNSEAAMKYLNSLDPSKIDWEKEIERQKRNARD
jgi:hypothetical protein